MYRPSSTRKSRIENLYEWLTNRVDQHHQQLKDPKNIHDEEKVIGAQVDTISISEVCEKVTALNDEIFQAVDTLGGALIHERRALSLADLDAAAAESQEMVGEKITNILITQSQNPESEINPVLLQVVLRIFMAKFCVSKIQSWYPDSDNSAAGDILSGIYSEIRSTGMHRNHLKIKLCLRLTYSNF